MPSILENTLWERPLAVIGDEDRVDGFQALGFKVYALKQPAEFKDVLDKVAAQQCAVCLVQEDIYRREEERIKSYRNAPLPVLIPFSLGGKMDLPSASLRGELGKIIQGIRLRATGTC